MVVAVAVALCWCYCSRVALRKRCVHDAFVRASKEREREMGGERAHLERKKERETWSISTPAFVPNRKWCQEIRFGDDSIVQRRGDAPSTPLVASSSKALCALLFAARARSFFFFLFSFFSLSFSAGCCCCWSLKASSFFLNRRVSFK